MGYTIHGNLMLFHYFQKGRLGFGTGTVDFIRQHDLAHDSAFFEFHFTCLEIDQRETGHVRRHEVGCELNPAEGTVQRTSQGAGQRGFTDTGNVLNQYVAFAEQGNERIFNGFFLTDNSLADVLLKGEDHSAGIDHRVPPLIKKLTLKTDHAENRKKDSGTLIILP